MSLKFDLICLGSGPAASTVATTCANQGWNVAVAESRQFGGTCALRGCNPKKVFTNAASLFDQVQRAQGRLARGSDNRVVWSDLVGFQRQFTDPVREQSEAKLRKRGIATFRGLAKFRGEREIEVGDQLLEAEHIFIGVGARPALLKIPGEELSITSDDFMELPSLPSEIVFLGGGFIAFEFAHIAARAGASVTIVDRNKVPLESFDPDLVRLLVKCTEAAGIKVLLESEPLSLTRINDRFQVMIKTADGSRSVDAGLIVNSGGRVANIEDLSLESGNITRGEHGVKVNGYLQSVPNPTVFAGGDCADTGVAMVTPTANESARVAAANLLAGKPSTSIDFGPVPQVVFSVPPVANVGMSEADARERGIDLDIRYEDLSTKGEVRKLCAAAAGCKIILDRRTDQILGAHLLGPHADEVINLFTLAIRHKLTAANLKSTLLSYPTMTAEYCRLL